MRKPLPQKQVQITIRTPGIYEVRVPGDEKNEGFSNTPKGAADLARALARVHGFQLHGDITRQLQAMMETEFSQVAWHTTKYYAVHIPQRLVVHVPFDSAAACLRAFPQATVVSCGLHVLRRFHTYRVLCPHKQL